MKSISLSDYLHADNAWTKRLLGSEPFQMSRTSEKIAEEYENDKWGKMLKQELRDMEHAKAVEYETILGFDWRTTPTVVSFGDELFLTDSPTFNDIFYSIVRNRIGKYKGAAYCELGCGYGYNLSLFPEPRYGGEFTDAGVSVAKKMGFDSQHFDFYDRNSYKMIRPGSVVYTIQALEQIPDSTNFLEGMRSQKQNIDYVVHFEGSVLPERKNLLGLFRNRYQELNDYNRNLVELLRNAPDVEILELELDSMGSVPLNSLHYIVWRFKKN